MAHGGKYLEKRTKVIIIGGGAAGIMAAVSAADAGASVTIIEKNEKLGKKLYITGKGRCNITNNSDIQNLLLHVVSNPKFLYSAFSALNSQELMDFLENSGLKIQTERGNRVFPASGKSSDVIRTFKSALEKRKVKIYYNTEVQGINTEDGIFKSIDIKYLDGSGRKGTETIKADAVIVATGGISYPSTGSTGDGYKFATDTGHSIKKTSPSLVPVNIKESFAKELQGLSLRNVELTLKDGKKVLYKEMGEMLFTHFGISGPLVLTSSCYMSGKDITGMKFIIDLKPALTNQQLNERILRDFSECKNSSFKNSLGRLLPSKLIPVIVALSGINPDKKVNSVTKQERAGLTELLKEFVMTPESLRGYNEAVITKGGIMVKEISPATMESKKVRGMYFAGEVIDVDAMTGGYNLQIAWSTGFLAGKSATGL
ncbi:MAG: NAD(P)/FAD-dependent oxidoreductase [Lachnospiraceae bacterium]|nr:NAD(P)/FAD-dependent oxidoreductase [Lachnospiraceae bacterium]